VTAKVIASTTLKKDIKKELDDNVSCHQALGYEAKILINNVKQNSYEIFLPEYLPRHGGCTEGNFQPA
jgi:hypothetical protein